MCVPLSTGSQEAGCTSDARNRNTWAGTQLCEAWWAGREGKPWRSHVSQAMGGTLEPQLSVQLSLGSGAFSPAPFLQLLLAGAKMLLSAPCFPRAGLLGLHVQRRRSYQGFRVPVPCTSLMFFPDALLLSSCCDSVQCHCKPRWLAPDTALWL